VSGTLRQKAHWQAG